MTLYQVNPRAVALAVLGVALLTAGLHLSARGASEDPTHARIQLEVIAEGFERPVFLTHAADGTGALYVIESAGRIRVLHPDGIIREQPFLDISDRVIDIGLEQGLLGLAFHPEYRSNGRLFVHYTRVPDGRVVISEFRASGGVTDPTTERVLLEVAQPGNWHNGGTVAFDGSGYLLVSLGDGGSLAETVDIEEKRGSLLGKILRLDVDGGDPYVIPPDNGFADQPGIRPEVHVMGLRNPYRFSVDPVGGHIFIGDVGHNDWEEVDVVLGGRGGLHFGWDELEGPGCSPRVRSCDPGAHEPPVIAYAHRGEGGAVIGGYIYRGVREPTLQGVYLFGDWISGKIWGVPRDELLSGAAVPIELGGLGVRTRLASFGEGEDGELYVVDSAGRILRIAARVD